MPGLAESLNVTHSSWTAAPKSAFVLRSGVQGGVGVLEKGRGRQEGLWDWGRPALVTLGTFCKGVSGPWAGESLTRPGGPLPKDKATAL